MRRNGDRGLVGGDREILDRSYGFHRTGDRWLPDRWLGMPKRVTDFDPTTVAGLKGWWKSDAIPDAVNGGGVNPWPDQSGNHNDLIYNSVNSPPTFYTNMLNGKPSVGFNQYVGSMLTLTTPIPAAPYTIFAVIKSDGASFDICPFGSMAGDAIAGPLNNSGAYYLGYNGWLQSNRSADFNWHVVCGSTAPELFVDGVPAPGTKISTTPAPQPLTVMGARFNNNYSSGHIAEALYYQGVLSDIDKANINGYLMDRYALRPNPPWSVPGLTFWLDASQITAAGGTLREVIKEGIKDAIILPSPQLGEPEVTPLLADGTALTGWMDKASNNSPAGTATYKTNIINARPVVRFNGTSEGMNANAGTLINYSGPLTTFVVAKLPSGIRSWVTSWVGGGNYIGLSELGYLGVAVPAAGTWLEDSTDHSGAFHVLTGIYGGDNASQAPGFAYVDGVQVASGPLRSYVSILGIMRDGAAAYPGDVAEVLTFKGALSDADRKSIEDYLKAKYALPVTPPAFTDPTSIPGLSGWWKADALALSDGATVASWTDSSGNGYALPAFGAGPTYKTNILNGKPVLRFNGTNNGLFNATAFIGQPLTIFIVGKVTLSAFNGFIAVAGLQFGLDATGHLYANLGTQSLAGSVVRTGAFHVFTLASILGTGRAYVDGNPELLPQAVGNGGFGNFVFMTTGGGAFTNGDIAEMVIYNGNLSTTDRQNVENYLKTKYAVTGTRDAKDVVKLVGKILVTGQLPPPEP